MNLLKRKLIQAREHLKDDRADAFLVAGLFLLAAIVTIAFMTIDTSKNSTIRHERERMAQAAVKESFQSIRADSNGSIREESVLAAVNKYEEKRGLKPYTGGGTADVATRNGQVWDTEACFTYNKPSSPLNGKKLPYYKITLSPERGSTAEPVTYEFSTDQKPSLQDLKNRQNIGAEYRVMNFTVIDGTKNTGPAGMDGLGACQFFELQASGIAFGEASDAKGLN